MSESSAKMTVPTLLRVDVRRKTLGVGLEVGLGLGLGTTEVFIEAIDDKVLALCLSKWAEFLSPRLANAVAIQNDSYLPVTHITMLLRVG